MLKFFNRKRKKRGQAIVEMAVVFPFFLIIVLGGLVDFGFAFYNFLTLQQIVNDTARYAATKPDSASSYSLYAQNQKPSWWTSSFTVHNLETEKVKVGGPKKDDELIYIVSASYESPTYTPFYQTLLEAVSDKRSITLAAKAAFKKPVYGRNF